MIDLAGSERAANTQVGYWMHLSKYFQFSIEHDIIALHWCNGTPPRRLSKYFTFSIEPDTTVQIYHHAQKTGLRLKEGGGWHYSQNVLNLNVFNVQSCSIIYFSKRSHLMPRTRACVSRRVPPFHLKMCSTSMYSIIYFSKKSHQMTRTRGYVWRRVPPLLSKCVQSQCIQLYISQKVTSNDQNTGLRLKEGAAINRSLLALGNCINALAEKKTKYFSNQPHIINIITTFRYVNYHYRHNYNHPYHHHI